VPFVSKTFNVNFITLATKIMASLHATRTQQTNDHSANERRRHVELTTLTLSL